MGYKASSHPGALGPTCRHHDTVCRVVAHWQDHTDGTGQCRKGGTSSDVVVVNTNEPFDGRPGCGQCRRVRNFQDTYLMGQA